MFNDENLKKIIECYGEKNQLVKAMSELGELVQALAEHVINEDEFTLCNLIEEIADVKVMIRQVEMILEKKQPFDVPAIMDAKVRRQLMRIDSLNDCKQTKDYYAKAGEFPHRNSSRDLDSKQIEDIIIRESR